MSPGSLNIDDILDRFRQGLGVVLSKDYTVHSVKASRQSNIEVYLFPQGLCKPGANGLIIVAGKGHFIWDGTYKLTGIKLVGAGIQPMPLAHDIAAIANAMSVRMAELSAPPEQPLAIEAPKKENG